MTREEPGPTSTELAGAAAHTRRLRIARRVWLPASVFVFLILATAAVIVLKRPLMPANGGTQSDAVPHPPRGSEIGGAWYRQELARLEAAVENDPGDTLALAALADFALAAHQAERALVPLDQWLEIAPESIDALEQKTVALASIQRFEEALEVNRTLFRQDPARLHTRLNMGALFANLEVPDSASAWWGDIIAEAPESEEAAIARRGLQRLAEMANGSRP